MYAVIWSINYIVPFIVKYLSRIRAGYVCKRGMLIKNRISFHKPNVNYSVADELVYGLVVWFFSSLFACLIRTSIIIMFAELCWRTGMQSLGLLLCSFFKRLALHCNCENNIFTVTCTLDDRLCFLLP